MEGGPQYYMMMKVLTLHRASLILSPGGREGMSLLPGGIKVHGPYMVSTNTAKERVPYLASDPIQAAGFHYKLVRVAG